MLDFVQVYISVDIWSMLFYIFLYDYCGTGFTGSGTSWNTEATVLKVGTRVEGDFGLRGLGSNLILNLTFDF